MYDGTHKLHKGIDNTLRFKIKDTDRKPIDLTNKTIYGRCMTEILERMYYSNTLLSPTQPSMGIFNRTYG